MIAWQSAPNTIARSTPAADHSRSREGSPNASERATPTADQNSSSEVFMASLDHRRFGKAAMPLTMQNGSRLRESTARALFSAVPMRNARSAKPAAGSARSVMAVGSRGEDSSRPLVSGGGADVHVGSAKNRLIAPGESAIGLHQVWHECA